jgi:hypothetical protein
MQLQGLSRHATLEKPQRRSATATEPVVLEYAIEEINAYIAIRNNLLAEAEETTTNGILRRLCLANDFVESCLKPVRSPYETQFLPEPDADRERKRCAAIRARISQLRAQAMP